MVSTDRPHLQGAWTNGQTHRHLMPYPSETQLLSLSRPDREAILLMQNEGHSPYFEFDNDTYRPLRPSVRARTVHRHTFK